MPKLDIEKIKRESIAVFETKACMLKYIKKVAFKGYVMQIKYFHKKWFVRWK